MCGIVGYIGSKQAYPIIIKGLKRLEYRGYDSAGIAILNNQIKNFKKQGKVTELEKHVVIMMLPVQWELAIQDGQLMVNQMM